MGSERLLRVAFASDDAGLAGKQLRELEKNGPVGSGLDGDAILAAWFGNNKTEVTAMMKRAKGAALETHLAKKLRPQR